MKLKIKKTTKVQKMKTKTATLTGEGIIDSYACRRMKEMGGAKNTWYAYQLKRIGDEHNGHLEFVMHGPGGKEGDPAYEHPLPTRGKGYYLVGKCNLDTCRVEAI